MAQFDVHKASSGRGYLMVCQNILLDGLESRVVVPLLPMSAFKPAARLHPTFSFKGADVFMSTHQIFAIPTMRLGPIVGSLAQERYAIANAIDMLWSGV